MSVSSTALSGDDRWSILAAYARYAHTIDDGDAEGWAACFTEDGVLWSSRGTAIASRRGLEEFARAYIAQRTLPERHLSWHHLLEPDGEACRGRCSAALIRPATAGAAFAFSATYRDLFVRAGERWLIARRDVHYDEVPAAAVTV